MTSAAGLAGNFGAVYARLFWLKVPTGTTATIKVTFGTNSPTSTQNHIAVYRVLDAVYSSGGNDGSTDMDATDPLTTGSITIPTGGAFIAVAGGATDGTGKTWANATEDIDADAGALRFTTATRATALTTTAVTCTGGTNGEDGALSYIIFTDNTEPTVALSSPSDSATGVSTTPDLVFTGTDTDSDDVRYEVQVDTLNTFNGVVINSDDFNRADENPIGGNWTNDALGEGADNQLKIVSNQLKAVTAGTSCEMYWNANTFSSATDLEMYFTVVTKPGNGQRVEMGYMQDLAGLRDMYQMLLIDNTGAGNDTFTIQRVDNASATTLATSSSLEYSNGDVIGFRRTRDGVFSIVQNGSVVLSTSADTTYTGNFYAEVCIRDTTGVLDNWGVKRPLIDAVSGTDAGFSGTINGNGVSITNIVASDNATPGTSFTTSSISPVANRLYLLTVNTRNDSSTQPVAPTVTGAGLTWVSLGVASNYDTTTTSMRSMFMFRARGSSPSSGALTVDFGATSHTGIIYNIDEFTGIDGSGTNGSGAVVQVVSNADSSSSASSITGTLSAFGSSQNATYAVFCNGTNALTATAGTGFAKVGEYQATNSNTAGRMVSEFKSTNDTTADLTYSSTCQLGVIAVEIKAGDPFQSGTSTTYAVQSTLSNSTVYYWRVRAIDPSGSNNYGAWATTRSFTTTDGGGGGAVQATGFMTTNTSFWG